VTVLLLPVYRPSEHLPELVEDLGDGPVVVVDDGSGPESEPVLDAAAGLGCTVLRHAANRGKGVALKTALTHVISHFPDHDVVTADADGQHSTTDIRRIAGRVGETGHIVLGVRSFDTDVPARSRFGNTLTRALFRAATGDDVRDTQTGLRGYPAALLPWLLGIPGERFEYEMNVLLRASRDGRPVEQVTITTTYLADNASSHFGSLSDSVRIYRPLLRQMLLLRRGA
jgi:glycosyltransferase involved in cell wall biosynthesis